MRTVNLAPDYISTPYPPLSLIRAKSSVSSIGVAMRRLLVQMREAIAAIRGAVEPRSSDPPIAEMACNALAAG